MTGKSAKKSRVLVFSLRFLLVVLTTVAVLFGLRSQKARKQAAAVDAILAAGGHISYAYEYPNGIYHGTRLPNPKPRGNAWLRSRLGPEYFDRPVYVQKLPRASESRLDDELLRHIGNLTSVTNLNMAARYDCPATPRGVSNLRNLRKLESCIINHLPVTDDNLRELSSLPALTHLSVYGSDITDQGLEHILTMTNLKSLDVGFTSVTDQGLSRLHDLSQLETLLLRHAENTTPDGIAGLQKALPNCRIIVERGKLSNEMQATAR